MVSVQKKRLKKMTIITGCLIVSLAAATTCVRAESVSFAVISDHKADHAGLEKALTFLAAQRVDFIIVAGDFSPLRDAYPDYYARWGFLVDRDTPPDRQDVYFVIGNHDGKPSGEPFFQTEIAPFYPENGPPGAPMGTIFSFDRGNGHFVVTNQYWNDREGGYTSEQLAWIERDLQSTDQRFTFVIGHEPAFPLDRHVADSLDVNPEMRDVFWNILAENDVRAFFCGHTHHLSAVKSQGVYQLDTGEITASHISIVIVEMNDTKAVARLYETAGWVPEAADDNAFNASLRENGDGDEAYKVVFSSDIEHDNNSFMGCFVQTVGY